MYVVDRGAFGPEKSTAPTKYVVKLASGAKLAAPRAKTRAAANCR